MQAITGEHVKELGDEDLRLLVIKLCEAELRQAGHPASSIFAGGNQTAKDGGIDVRVDLPLIAKEGLDFIARPATGFQVKCEDMPAAEIEDEMCPEGKLRQSIKDLIAGGGAYIIVSSKGTVSDIFLKKRIAAMALAVKAEPNASNLKLDFYDRERLARWVRQYAGVELWLRDRINKRLQGWQAYAAWSGGPLGAAYLQDETARLLCRVSSGLKALPVADGADLMREVLRRPGGVARLIGLSGTGKTRLVQALCEPDLGAGQPLDTAFVHYTDLGHSPDPNVRDMLIHLGSNAQRAIVVVDNCNPSAHRTFAEIVLRYPSYLSLITVEYDVADEDSPEATDVYELAPASDSVVISILQRHAPHLSHADIHLITGFSGGNARIALVLARTVLKGESLGVLNDVELFRRLFRQTQADDPQLQRAAESSSLVYSFNGEDTDDASELKILGTLANMTALEFYRHVETLRRRELIQTRSRWRAFLPPALANRLAKAALQSIPPTTLIAAFAQSPRLLASFARRLEYLHDSEPARIIATQWLDDPRWLKDFTNLDEQRRALLLNVAPLVPRKVLSSLTDALAPLNVAGFLAGQKSDLLGWATLTRHLAHDPQHFDEAAWVLLRLAESEEGNSVNLRDAFREVFRIGLSGTLAPVEQRVRVLMLAVVSPSERYRALAIDAAEAMLEMGHISSSHDFTFGARSNAHGWTPASDEEVTHWLEVTFAMIRKISSLGEQELQAVRKAMAANFRELWLHEPAHAPLTALMTELSVQGWPEGWVAIKSTLRHDGSAMPPEMRGRLRALAASTAPQSLFDEIFAYIGTHAGGILDVADALDESDEEEDSNPMQSWERVHLKAKELGEAASVDTKTLEAALPHLHCIGDNRSVLFGHGLSSSSPILQDHWELLTRTYAYAGANRNAGVFVGFMQGLRERDEALAHQILTSLVTDPVLGPAFPLIFGSPQDDADGDRLLAAIAKRVAGAHTYQPRTKTDMRSGLSMGKFCEVIKAMAGLDDGLIAAIFELVREIHLLSSDHMEIPMELIELGRTLLQDYQFGSKNHNDAHRITELSKRCLAGPQGAHAASQLATRLAAALDDYRVQSHQYGELACVLFKLHPAIAMDALLTNSQPRRRRALRDRPFTRKGSVLHCAPLNAVLAWVKTAPAERAALVASEIDLLEKVERTDTGRSALDDDKGVFKFSELASQLLLLAPDKKPVLAAFNQNFHPSHYSGSLGETLGRFLPVLEQLSTGQDEEVAAWALENIQSIQRRSTQDRATESLHEERFE